MPLCLMIPNPSHGAAWQEMVAEWKAAGEPIVPYALTLHLKEFGPFLQETQRFARGEDLGEWVRADLYFLVESESPEKLLGAVSVRHELNESLLLSGGHIGYGIRPSCRRRGYATEQLALALEKCRGLGLQRVLLTCNSQNSASAKVIQKNSGVLENEVQTEDGAIFRYWIAL